MPKICYVERDFSKGALAVIERANAIIAEYVADGFTLTLRQLYYQFVARGHLKNRQQEYKRLGSIVSDARLAGLIDWDAIEDRTRSLRSNPSWRDPSDIVAACASQFNLDLWKGQKHRVEVWIEKDALLGVIEGVCKRNDVPFFSCRGYTSQSELWSAGRRLREHRRRGYAPVVLHLGDHDPSGLDMTRDVRERLELFAEGKVEVRRLALNMDQVEEYGPPPNPAKLTDSRAEAYIAEHGESSWELDALDPKMLDALIESNIVELRERLPWEAMVRERDDARRALSQAAERWAEVETFLEDGGGS